MSGILMKVPLHLWLLPGQGEQVFSCQSKSKPSARKLTAGSGDTGFFVLFLVIITTTTIIVVGKKKLLESGKSHKKKSLGLGRESGWINLDARGANAQICPFKGTARRLGSSSGGLDYSSHHPLTAGLGGRMMGNER